MYMRTSVKTRLLLCRVLHVREFALQTRCKLHQLGARTWGSKNRTEGPWLSDNDMQGPGVASGPHIEHFFYAKDVGCMFIRVC